MATRSFAKAGGYVTANLKSGVGRYVCQLQRITLKFCKSHGTSRGMREYIEKDLVDFAKENPGIVVYLKPRRHRDPYLVAEYLNGNRDEIRCNNFSALELVKWIDYLRTKSGEPIVKLLKQQRTYHPSIQGPWTPFTNIPTDGRPVGRPEDMTYQTRIPSATEQLLELAKRQE